MPENINSGNVLEAEIAELSRQIEAKRNQLEQAGKTIEDRDAISTVIREHLAAPAPTAPAAPPAAVAGDDYLNTLDDEVESIVGGYIASLEKEGIKSTLNKIRQESPLTIDVFHDWLVDRLYDELKTRGFIK